MQKITIAIVFLATLLACEEDSYYIEPNAQFTISADSVSIFEKVTFSSLGSGQFFSVFTGDPGHEYGKDSSTGINAFEGKLDYTYVTTGTYTVTFIASGYKQDGTETSDVQQKTIHVYDGVTSIEFISVFLNSNQYYLLNGGRTSYKHEAGLEDGNKIVIPLYHYARYRDSQLRRNLRSIDEFKIIPKISLNIGSEVQYDIEGADSNFKNTGDRSNENNIVSHTNETGTDFVPKRYSLKSAEGKTIGDFSILAMMAPDFELFDIGVAYLNGKTNFGPDVFTYSIDLTVPAGTDVSSIAAAFSTYRNGVDVKVNGTPQESGVTVNNFSEPVIYELTYKETHGDDEFSITSTITVNVTVAE